MLRVDEFGAVPLHVDQHVGVERDDKSPVVVGRRQRGKRIMGEPEASVSRHLVQHTSSVRACRTGGYGHVGESSRICRVLSYGPARIP